MGRKRRRQRRIFFFFAILLIAAYLALVIFNNREAIFRYFVKPVGTPEKLSIVELKSGKIEFTWSAVKKADGYRLYKYSYKSNTYVPIKKFNKNTTTYISKFDDSKYAVKAYKMVGGKADYSEKSAKATVKKITDMIEIVGHRGAMDKAPENTLASYKQAYESGYAGFETDYWETYSGDFIISHGSDIYPSAAVHKNVKELTEETRKNYPVKLGSNVDKYATQYLPSLEEAVSTASSLKLNIYLHTKNVDVSGSGLEKLRAIIEKYNMRNKATVFTSQRDMFIKLKEYKLRTGFLILPESEADIEDAVNFAGKNSADVFIMHYTPFLKKSHIKEAHKYKLKVGCYDTSNLNSAFKMVEYDVDFMITNKDFLN